MRSKKFVGRSSIIALFFFALNTFFVMPVYAGETKVSATREIAITTIDEALQELADNAEEYQEYIDMAADYLPEDSINTLNAIISVAQLDISTEEKIDTLIEISQANCSIYAQIWIVGWLMRFIPIVGIFASLLTDIGYWGLILCLIGII